MNKIRYLWIPLSRFVRNYHLVSIAILFCLLIAGCQSPIEPSRWEAVQQASQNQPVTTAEVIAGGEFNKFFPKTEDPFDIVYLQEKEGFAEAGLLFEGDEVATLAVSDTNTNPDALEKFAESDDTLEGYPMAAVGDRGTAILVADRIQVQVRSNADDFAPADRETWLLEFDLDGLASLLK
ncbi:MAG: hypothetical protein KF893_13000 [Caldilineaceae bacterium]|nr:hypothetical protein [Caldilineaceae bacterium]